MKTIHAVYENGVFRPTGPVDLAEGSEVTIKPKSVAPASSRPGDPNAEAMAAVCEVLSHSYKTGETDLAARHDEHQP